MRLQRHASVMSYKVHVDAAAVSMSPVPALSLTPTHFWLCIHRYLEPRTSVGVIIGTGTNACYVESAPRLSKWKVCTCTWFWHLIHVETLHCTDRTC
jgi:hexokinase